MSACEKCWSEAHRGPQFSVAEEYQRLMAERKDHPCTPEEQAGPGAGLCPWCSRLTLHQITREPMCGCDAADPMLRRWYEAASPYATPDALREALMTKQVRNDDVPAFPCDPDTFNAGGLSGMSLRDYFAAAALKSGQCPYNVYEYDNTAAWSYCVADAMLKARSN